LPYAEPHQIVILNETSPQLPNASVTRYNYDDWRARAQSFSAMGAFRPTSMTITGSGEPERVPAKMISANLLPLLGVTITQGRGFSGSDDVAGAEGVAILSAALAQRTFPAASPLGQSILLDNRAHTIVGVMPASSSSCFSRRSCTCLSARGRRHCPKIAGGIREFSRSRG
jgi:putative ABC transport system permease protein